MSDVPVLEPQSPVKEDSSAPPSDLPHLEPNVPTDVAPAESKEYSSQSPAIGEYEVESIIAKRIKPAENGQTVLEYLVKWRNYGIAEATWERKSNIYDCEKLIDDFERLSKHCADNNNNKDSSAVPRRRGRPPKRLTAGRGIPLGRLAYGGQSDRLSTLDERDLRPDIESAGPRPSPRASAYMPSRRLGDFSNMENIDLGPNVRIDSRPRRRGRPPGRGRAYSVRGMEAVRSLSPGRRRRRRGARGGGSVSHGRIRGRYSRLGYPGTYSTMEEFIEAEEAERRRVINCYVSNKRRHFMRRSASTDRVVEAIDFIKDEKGNNWLIVDYECGTWDYVPYKYARQYLVPQLLDLYESTIVMENVQEPVFYELEQIDRAAEALQEEEQIAQ